MNKEYADVICVLVILSITIAILLYQVCRALEPENERDVSFDEPCNIDRVSEREERSRA